MSAVSAYRGVATLTNVPTFAATFVKQVASDPARPMLTWYDATSGERTELSGATLANWVAKTANLLVDGLGLGAGDVAGVDLPPHWQSAAIMLGCWTAGLSVSSGRKGDVSFGLTGSDAEYAVGLHPFALPVRELTAGQQDWVLSARVHGDYYGGPPADPAAPAWEGLSHSELVANAQERANELGLSQGDRALFNVDTRPLLDWLLAPVAAGSSMVLCRNADAATMQRWAATERVTRQHL